jgi:RNA polymerase sigma factor (sigma-70 family)
VFPCKVSYDSSSALLPGEDRRGRPELLVEAKRFVSWWADGKLPPWVDRDDLVQEVLIAWNATEGKPKPYRTRAAINRMIDHLRTVNHSGQHRAGHSQPSAPEDIERDAGEVEAYPENVLSRDQLARLRSLPDRYGAILYYRFVEEETQSQVGERFGIAGSRVARIERRALELLRDEPSSFRRGAISKREREILSGAAEGESAQETATRLGRSIETIKVHRRNVIAKLNARNITHAVHLAHGLNLLA